MRLSSLTLLTLPARFVTSAVVLRDLSRINLSCAYRGIREDDRCEPPSHHRVCSSWLGLGHRRKPGQSSGALLLATFNRPHSTSCISRSSSNMDPTCLV